MQLIDCKYECIVTYCSPSFQGAQQLIEEPKPVLSNEEILEIKKKTFIMQNKELNISTISNEALIALHHVADNVIQLINKNMAWNGSLYSLKLVCRITM